MKGSIRRGLGVGIAAVSVAVSGAAAADDEGFFANLFDGISIGGFFQIESAYRLTDDQNPNNQTSNPFNNRTVSRSGLPAVASGITSGAQDVLDTLGGVLTGLGLDPVANGFDALNLGQVGLNDQLEKGLAFKEDNFNMTFLRGEVDIEWPIARNVRLKATMRAIFDVDRYKQFDDEMQQFPTQQAPLNAIGTLNGNSPNLFEYRYESWVPQLQSGLLPGEQAGGEAFFTANTAAIQASNARLREAIQGDESSSYLEVAGQDYMLDFPNLYLDIEFGALLIRAGNQQIAWGDALFFRILDVPNGLDLRRHGIFDVAVEEFSDKRIPSLGIRASYTTEVPLLPGEWEFDGYVQRFRPTILPNPNTPYNIIPSQFTVRDNFKDFDSEANYGIRIRGNLGPVELQLVANRRYNPLGAFTWTANGVEEDGLLLPVPNSGLILSRTPFEVDGTGVTSATEFSTFGARTHLDHFEGLNAAIREFPAAQQLLAAEVDTNDRQLQQEDFFFQLTGGLRGHIRREYFRENNYGLGASYRVNETPFIGGQTIVSLEGQYTPDRVFTPISLDPNPDELIVEDEYQIAFVAERFQRFTAGFPAMFMVLQHLHNSESDLVGFHLSGYGSRPRASVNDPTTDTTSRSSYNATVFAFQQPFPNRVWVVNFATLYDWGGGILVQPGVAWKPNREWKVETYVNYVDHISGNRYEDTLDAVGFIDELNLRINYQF